MFFTLTPQKWTGEVRKTHPRQGKIHQEFTFPGRKMRKFGVLVGHLITEWRLVDGVDVRIYTFDWWSWKKAQIPDDIRQNSLSSTSGPCYPMVHSKQMPFWVFFKFVVVVVVFTSWQWKAIDFQASPRQAELALLCAAATVESGYRNEWENRRIHTHT